MPMLNDETPSDRIFAQKIELKGWPLEPRSYKNAW